jgi:hypothetical protein
MLPDMPIPLSAFDEPMIYAPYARKHHPGSTPMVDPADDAGHVDWHEMCAPDSNVNHPQVDNRFAFVDDAVAAGDACKSECALPEISNIRPVPARLSRHLSPTARRWRTPAPVQRAPTNVWLFAALSHV